MNLSKLPFQKLRIFLILLIGWFVLATPIIPLPLLQAAEPPGWHETSLVADYNVVDLAINPKNPQEIWAVTGPGWVSQGSIYRSQDGGTT